MKRTRKKYERPLKLWDKQRIEKEKELLKKYGLKKKREIWKAEALLRKYRRLARALIAKRDKEKEKILIDKLTKLGLLENGSSLEDALDLTVENVLDRRLQTVILNKGFVNSINQARQFISHGHVRIGNRKIIYPSYLVSRDEENNIQVAIMVGKKGIESG